MSHLRGVAAVPVWVEEQEVQVVGALIEAVGMVEAGTKAETQEEIVSMIGTETGTRDRLQRIVVGVSQLPPQ